MFSDLRDNKMVRFKTETVDGKDIMIVSYMISTIHFWDSPNAIECRGSAFDLETGECISAAFPKFFNVNERADTQENLIKDQIVEVYDKIDGSMIVASVINDSVYFKTKKSYFSDVANEASKNATDNVFALCKDMQERGWTPIFEYTSPNHRIVINYGDKSKFTLLALRHNKTGNIARHYRLKEVAERYGVIPVKCHNLSWGELKDICENKEGIEGFVLRLEDGRYVKMKTDWYLKMHHTSTNLRIRDVVAAIIDGTVDDLKSHVASQGFDISQIEVIENEVIGDIVIIKAVVDDVVEEAFAQNKTIRDVAFEMKGNTYFGLIMTKMRGKEPDYMKWWKNRYFKDTPLKSVYNENF
jgi:RNA ligase